MFKGYPVYDADGHAFMTPAMWDDLPREYVARRPRPARISDDADLGAYSTGWFIDGRLEPHCFGPGAQQSNTPRLVLDEFADSSGAPSVRNKSLDMSDPQARLRDLEQLGYEAQVIFPSTTYAQLTSDAGFEAALFRAFNRHMARQCKADPKRLKWAALLPLRDPRQALEAIEEMQELGASTAVVFGTAGDRLLSHPSFTPAWDEFSRTGLPLCVHMGMSFPPLAQLCESIFDGHVLGMCLPAQLAFIAIVGHSMLDRYPDLKVAFLEFGAEWLLYMVERMDHYLPRDRGDHEHKWGLSQPLTDRLPRQAIIDYVKSGRIFIAPEADDPLLPLEIDLLGEGQILFCSDYPHGEGRENAVSEILERSDLTDDQKRKILYHNAINLYGEL